MPEGLALPKTWVVTRKQTAIVAHNLAASSTDHDLHPLDIVKVLSSQLRMKRMKQQQIPTCIMSKLTMMVLSYDLSL